MALRISRDEQDAVVIFIDANIFLAFYHLTSDDLEELRKLIALLKKGDVVLCLPEQVSIEYQRNRENKIATALKNLKTQKLNLIYPAICKDYPEYEELRHTQGHYEETHEKLVDKISKDVEARSLKADEVIAEIMSHARYVETSAEILDRATLRQRIGNPPGKRDSLGDAINWESLLQSVPNEDDLYLITDDGDFYSPLDKDTPMGFLVQEWKEKKNSNLHFYRRMSLFFKEHYPDIKFAADFEKERAVQALVGSYSFATTHAAISRLLQFEGFTSAQVNQIVEAALDNPQVNWILADGDVFTFMAKMLKDYSRVINVDSAALLQRELDARAEAMFPDQEVEDDLPF